MLKRLSKCFCQIFLSTEGAHNVKMGGGIPRNMFSPLTDIVIEIDKGLIMQTHTRLPFFENKGFLFLDFFRPQQKHQFLNYWTEFRANSGYDHHRKNKKFSKLLTFGPKFRTLGAHVATESLRKLLELCVLQVAALLWFPEICFGTILWGSLRKQSLRAPTMWNCVWR